MIFFEQPCTVIAKPSFNEKEDLLNYLKDQIRQFRTDIIKQTQLAFLVLNITKVIYNKYTYNNQQFP